MAKPEEAAEWAIDKARELLGLDDDVTWDDPEPADDTASTGTAGIELQRMSLR